MAYVFITHGWGIEPSPPVLWLLGDFFLIQSFGASTLWIGYLSKGLIWWLAWFLELNQWSGFDPYLSFHYLIQRMWLDQIMRWTTIIYFGTSNLCNLSTFGSTFLWSKLDGRYFFFRRCMILACPEVSNKSTTMTWSIVEWMVLIHFSQGLIQWLAWILEPNQRSSFNP
jgi:hypothetical protein